MSVKRLNSFIMAVLIIGAVALSSETKEKEIIPAEREFTPYTIREDEMKDMELTDQYPAIWRAVGKEHILKNTARARQMWAGVERKELFIS